MGLFRSHKDRDPAKGNISGKFTQAEIDAQSDRTQPLGRFRPQRRRLAESIEPETVARARRNKHGK
jgi:hypothetical protein